jgi:1-acyl-sn-glycerol-3-phosphate acyltransferase
MPESDSPQVRRDRITALVATALVCAVLPTVVLLVREMRGAGVSPRDATVWFGGSVAVGLLATLLYWGPYRALGFVPYAAHAWAAGSIYGVLADHWPGWLHGLALGVIVGAFVRARRGPQPGEENPALIAAVLAGAGVAWGFVVSEPPYDAAGYFVLAVALALVAWSWSRLFRPLFELSCEPLVWLLYAVRGRGPGLAKIPRTGPCLVIANHACWLDPLFLAKVVRRPITPMMTAKFFDLPVMRRLMVVLGVIRVPEKAIKKDTPEIQQAIAALDRGECVVIFPEGYLRRTEDRPLRRFGQGVWQILQARPDTPVFACWIEGGWGSYTSYANGPPTKNKKLDFRRPLTIAVSDAITVPAAVLADHMPTRLHLMNLVAAARAHIGLTPLPPFEMPTKGDDKSEEPPENAA